MSLGAAMGVGVAPTYEPRWKTLTRNLVAQAGSLVQAIYPGGLIAESGGNAQSWGSSVASGATLTNASASLFSVGYDSAGGFRYLSGAGENTKQLTAAVTGGTTQEVWLVCRPSALPFTSYRGAVQTLVSGASATRFFVGETALSRWFLPANGTRYIDNAASASVGAGWHVYKRYSDIAAANDSVSVGNDVGGLSSRSWQGDIAFIMLLNGQTNSTQQDAFFAELMAYHGIS